MLRDGTAAQTPADPYSSAGKRTRLSPHTTSRMDRNENPATRKGSWATCVNSRGHCSPSTAGLLHRGSWHLGTRQAERLLLQAPCGGRLGTYGFKGRRWGPSRLEVSGGSSWVSSSLGCRAAGHPWTDCPAPCWVLVWLGSGLTGTNGEILGLVEYLL